MSSFAIETTLDTKEPYTLELLGGPNASVEHQISGTLNLVVQKPVKLKQLFVAFVGEAYVTYNTTVVSVKSEPVNICRSEHNFINTPTLYSPGQYSMPFTLTLPGDLATTDSTKLKSDSLAWVYELTSCGVPTGMLNRRKIVRNAMSLRRVHVEPSDVSSTRFGAKRAGEFECSMFAPKIIGSKQNKVQLKVFLHPFTRAYRVKEIQATAIQTEKIQFDSKTIDGSFNNLRSMVPNSAESDPMALSKNKAERPLVKTDCAKIVSKERAVISNPDQEEFAAEWGREVPIEFELDLDPGEILPSEAHPWIQVQHGIRFTIVFADSNIKQMVIMAPFTIVNILEEMWSLQTTPDGITPPDYGEDAERSTLLDSNTGRMARSALYQEVYPERERIVPDVNDDLPPMYENEEERPYPYVEKYTP